MIDGIQIMEDLMSELQNLAKKREDLTVYESNINIEKKNNSYLEITILQKNGFGNLIHTLGYGKIYSYKTKNGIEYSDEHTVLSSELKKIEKGLLLTCYSDDFIFDIERIVKNLRINLPIYIKKYRDTIANSIFEFSEII